MCPTTPLTTYQQTGSRMTVTDDFFNTTIIDSIVPELLAQIQNIVIPDISITEEIGIGKVQLQLKGLSCDSAQLQTAYIELLASYGAILTFEEFSLRLSGGWEFKLLTYPYTYESGTLVVSCSNSSGILNLKIGTTSFPYTIALSLDAVNINLEDLNIELNGAGTFFNTLFSLIQPIIEPAIDSIISEGIEIVANEVFSEFDDSIIIEIIGDSVAILDQLSNPLIIDPYYVSLPFVGIYLYCQDFTDTMPNFNPPSIPTIFSNASIQHFLTLESIKSQFYAVFRAQNSGHIGPFNVTFSESNPNDASVLSILPFSLTSSDISQFIPEVNDLCTSSPCDIDITFDLTDQPYSLIMTSYSFVSDWNSLNIKLTGSNSSYIEMFVEMELEHVFYPDNRHYDVMQMFNMKQLSSFSLINDSVDVISTSEALLFLSIVTSVLFVSDYMISGVDEHHAPMMDGLCCHYF
ncbi:hypothetical protein ADUPG1_013617 [Aduncisulcus paluster]|uniref:Lipid-binding serum glycoprotein C-terminal domain-containing protein n=1 Tax=Aduncisulcus paluster TaxID=2918883 RepID=A0ABQ5K444_9EUKA|nr:hypothetical protein ADUPG1_013617 [Aduncisulcus paluster]